MSILILPPKGNSPIISFKEAKFAKEEIIWRQLEKSTVKEAVEEFLKGKVASTQKTYRSFFKKLFTEGFLNPSMTLQSFSLMNFENLLDEMRKHLDLSLSSKQVAMAAFVSLTKFLARKTEGFIRVALPNREEGAKTFVKIREKTSKASLTREELALFLEKLKEISPLYYFIAAIQAQGALRCSEALRIERENINWVESTIKIKRSKTRGTERYIYVSFPQDFMRSFREFLGGKAFLKGFIFFKEGGKRLINVKEVNVAYEKASRRIHLDKKVTSHTIRATTITLMLDYGIGRDEIMELTGHHRTEMVSYYDTKAGSRNPSKRLSFV